MELPIYFAHRSFPIHDGDAPSSAYGPAIFFHTRSPLRSVFRPHALLDERKISTAKDVRISKIPHFTLGIITEWLANILTRHASTKIARNVTSMQMPPLEDLSAIEIVQLFT